MGLLDLVFAERCAVCHAPRDGRPWCSRGPRVAGLRAWDAPHLCRACADALATTPVAVRLGDAVAIAAHREDRALVQLVGVWKYRGLRGVAWPLAELLEPAWRRAQTLHGSVDALVPMPLHGRRRRERGFNQAEVLCRLLAVDAPAVVLPRALRRRRATGQQASLAAAADGRARNVAGAFDARPPRDGEPRCVALVDDLITTGATWVAAAAALTAVGWDVRWGLALGAAARLTAATTLDTATAGP